MTDVEGNTYPIVKIGNQSWITENLKTTKCADGTPLSESNYKVNWKGKMTYNYVAVETCNICPSGWRVPTKEDIANLKSANLSAKEVKLRLKWTRDGLGSDLRVQEAVLGVYHDSDLDEVMKYGYGWTVKGNEQSYHGVRCMKTSGE